MESGESGDCMSRTQPKNDLISRSAALNAVSTDGGCGICTKRLLDIPAVDAAPVVRCRDCKHYEIKDHWAYFKNVPVLAASDVPTCHRWGDGECKTSPDGYCFLGERLDDDATN